MLALYILLDSMVKWQAASNSVTYSQRQPKWDCHPIAVGGWTVSGDDYKCVEDRKLVPTGGYRN